MSATTTQLLSSGEFCKLCYDTIPVKSASANVSFYTNNSEVPNFELWQYSSRGKIYAIDSATIMIGLSARSAMHKLWVLMFYEQ